jgi:hypothetical protein
MLGGWPTGDETLGKEVLVASVQRGNVPTAIVHAKRINDAGHA